MSKESVEKYLRDIDGDEEVEFGNKNSLKVDGTVKKEETAVVQETEKDYTEKIIEQCSADNRDINLAPGV